MDKEFEIRFIADNDSKRTKGLIFCKVSIKYRTNQSRFSPTDTNQPWKGATPILMKRATKTIRLNAG